MAKTSRQLEPAIHRVRLDRVTILEITEAELEALERGSPESIYLNLCVGTGSIGISFLISLLTTTIPNTQVFCVFVIATVVSLLASLTFGLLWRQSQQSSRTVAKRIRGRMPPEGDQVDSVVAAPLEGDSVADEIARGTPRPLDG
jgi:hypothetical protein